MTLHRAATHGPAIVLKYSLGGHFDIFLVLNMFCLEPEISFSTLKGNGNKGLKGERKHYMVIKEN